MPSLRTSFEKKPMPLQHIVWLKKKDHCTDQEMDAVLDEVAALATVISEISSISCGRNLTERANGFTHGLIVTLESPQALEVYAQHPAHVAVAKKLALHADILAMDYES